MEKIEDIKRIKPMEPILSPVVKEGEEYIHQIKWDGIRGITYIQDGHYRVFTKSGKERTGFYPELDHLTKLFQGKSGVLDGELIVLDDSLKPSFQLVMYRELLRTPGKLAYYESKYPVKYIVFDMMFLDGEDLREKSTEERIDLLGKTLKKSGAITLTDSFADGVNLFQLMKDKNYEGIVSKNRYSPYIGGKNHRDWFKTKIFKKMLTVIGGIKYNQDRIKSLLLGLYEEDGLRYVGNASIGLTSGDLQLLKEYNQVLETDKSPFNNHKKERDVVWVRPLLTCWVSFLEWSGDSLRHPKILGFSSQKVHEATGKEYTYYG